MYPFFTTEGDSGVGTILQIIVVVKINFWSLSTVKESSNPRKSKRHQCLAQALSPLPGLPRDWKFWLLLQFDVAKTSMAPKMLQQLWRNHYAFLLQTGILSTFNKGHYATLLFLRQPRNAVGYLYHNQRDVSSAKKTLTGPDDDGFSAQTKRTRQQHTYYSEGNREAGWFG